MDTKKHWEQVDSKTDPDALRWFQLHADQSLKRVGDTGLPATTSIIDIGGGASMLVDDLLAHGYSHLSVLDLSAAAMASARQRLGPLAQAVDWSEGDITAGLHAEFGMPFRLLRHEKEDHSTPRGGIQTFIHCHCRKDAP